MEIDLSKVGGEAAYPVLVGLIAPRPIAWVTSLLPAGIVNLAPFSFFNLFGVNPPMVAFSPTLKPDGSQKDTHRNVVATKEFVINASTEQHILQINESSRALSPDESETQWLNLPTLPSNSVRVRRLAEVPYSLECKLHQVVALGNGPSAGNLIIGEIVYAHVCDDILDATGQPDPALLKLVARMGGEYWCRTSDFFKQPRPV